MTTDSTSDLDSLFQKDPSSWTDHEIRQIISSMRNWRESFNKAEETKVPGTRTPTQAIAKTARDSPTPTKKPDLSDFIKDL